MHKQMQWQRRQQQCSMEAILEGTGLTVDPQAAVVTTDAATTGAVDTCIYCRNSYKIEF